MASATAFITAAIEAVVPTHVGGARHGVVEERAGDELAAAVVVVENLLHQGLAEPLRQRAVQFAADDHLVEDVAAIVDRAVGDDRERAGVGIDLDLGDVEAVRERERRLRRRPGIEVFVDGAAPFQLGGAGGEIDERDAAIGADDVEPAIFDTISPSAASNTVAAMRRPFSMTSSTHLTTEAPAVIAEREPTEA